MTSSRADLSPELSIVIPMYNMEALVEAIERHVLPVVESMSISCEIVFVDDGSKDGTWERIALCSEQNSVVKGVKLSRNFGQQIAVSAGVAKASGQYVIVMDGDMQHPPEAIPHIVARLKEGFDVVYTTSRVRNNWRDEASSGLFWFVVNDVLRTDMVPNQLMMRGMSRRFVTIYDRYPEATRTVAAICRDIGFKYTVLEVENRRRETGRGSYNLFKRLNLMINMIISISTAPLSFIIYISLAVFLLTVISSIFFIVNTILSSPPSGFTSIILAILFFGSTTTLILGVIGMYLSNIYTEVRRRPLYIVEKESGEN